MLAPLQNRDFRLLFIGLVVGQAMMPLQFVSQIFWVQEHAPVEVRIILVGIIGSMRGAGMLSFGLYGGALADRFDRRKLLIATQAGALVLNLAIALLMLLSPGDAAGLAVFFGLTFLASAMFGVDAPTRQAIVPEILGPRLTPSGIALNTAGLQISMPVSIFASGLLISSLGFPGTYALSASGHFIEIVALLMMGYRTAFAREGPRQPHSVRQTLRDMREGMVYVRGNPTVFWVIALMVAMMALGFPAVANLGPTWITTVVGQSFRNFGFIAITWGAGALLASMVLMRFSLFERKGMLVSIAAIGFACSFVVFCIGHTVANAVIGNLGLGVFMATGQVSSVALVQHLVHNEMRGRVMSLLLLNMGLAQLMTLPIAVLGQAVSLQTLFPILAFTVLGLVTLIVITQPRIWRARIPRAELVQRMAAPAGDAEEPQVLPGAGLAGAEH